LAAILALALAWLTLFGLSRQDDSTEAACELLIHDLVSDNPLLCGPTLDDQAPRLRRAPGLALLPGDEPPA
jgi:hypothetical protein